MLSMIKTNEVYVRPAPKAVEVNVTNGSVERRLGLLIALAARKGTEPTGTAVCPECDGLLRWQRDGIGYMGACADKRGCYAFAL